MESIVVAALEAARLELATLSGLVVADGACPSETWTLDEADLLRQIDTAIAACGTGTRFS